MIDIVRRETPKIDGSSTAFIVVVVVLVAIIITSCSAVVYLLRESALEDQRRRPYNTHPLSGRDLPNHRYSKKWYSFPWGSRDRYSHPRSDKSTNKMGYTSSGRGWIQTNDGEWDTDSADDRGLRSSEVNQSTFLRMSERRSSGSPIVKPHVYTPRMHSPASDATSSIHSDPHDLRGLPYPEQIGISPQGTIPSIQSQLCSPTSSSPPSPVPRRIVKSPDEPITTSPSHDSGHDSIRDPLPQSSAQALPTFGSGTKFFESL